MHIIQRASKAKENVQQTISSHSNFRRKCAAFDDFDCATPRFIGGNGLCLESANGEFPQYDRVYCGAAVPPDRENYMKNMLKGR